jgi:7-cyano-7-deazaguanine synthase
MPGLNDSVFSLLEDLVGRQVANGAPLRDVPLRTFMDLAPATRVLILVSGGLDSAVALYLAFHLKLNVMALQYEHPMRPKGESECAARLIGETKLPNFIIPYPIVHHSNFAEDANFALAESNAIYYSIAGCLAATCNAPWLISGTIFPDWNTEGHRNAMPGHFPLLNQILEHEHGEKSPRIMAPLLFSSKTDVIRLARALKFRLDRTWSCLQDEASPCGTCSQCRFLNDALCELDPLDA